MKIHLGLQPEVFDRLPGVPVKWKRGSSTGAASVAGLAAGLAIAGGGSRGNGAERTAMVRAQLARMVSSAPQVMVKVTGRQNGAAHTLANFQYIAGREGREGRDEGLETNEGEVVKDHDRMKEIAGEWDANNKAVGERRTGATSISMVFSMPPGTNADKLRDTVREFAAEEFGGHDWVLARHLDTEHPHVHLTVARVGQTRERLHPGPEELLHYRERFAELLRGRGIEADATRRFDRGLIGKRDRSPVHHAKQRAREKQDVSLMPATARASRQRAVDKVATIGLNDSLPLRPQDRAALSAQQQKRDTYAAAADALGRSEDPLDRELGDRLKTFVAGLPKPRSNEMERLVQYNTARLLRAADAQIQKGAAIQPQRLPATPERDPGRDR
jgi:hypothetical protein